MYTGVSQLFKTILSNFIKPEIINNENLQTINFKHPSNLLDIDEIYLGIFVSEKIKTCSKNDKDNFVHNCIYFYIELCEQIRKRFDFNSAILLNIGQLDPQKNP